MYLAGRAADVATTAVVLAGGGVELNPIWAPVYAAGWPAAAGLQLVAAAAVVAPMRRVALPWLRVACLVVFMGVSWLPVAWNVWQLTR